MIRHTQYDEQAAALRDALLPKLLSGELRVSSFAKASADKPAAVPLVEAGA